MTSENALDADGLLSGPRGRRLCLALATALDDDVRLATFYAASALDPGAVTSRAILTWPPGGGDLPTASAADVAEALAAARWRVPGESDLLRALDEAVRSARYWQEPDGEDVVTVTPEIRAALEPVAELVVASPHTRWWSTRVERSAQWSVVWHDGPEVHRAAGIAELDSWRADVVAEEAAARSDRPQDPTANYSGTWWSTPWLMPRTTRDHGAHGPVGLRFVEDSLGWERATAHRVAMADDARVLELDGPEAWADLCRRYPLDVTSSRRHDWYRTTGRSQGVWVQPDWAAVARDADAVHLSVAGYLTTAGLAVAVTDGVASVLAGWDPDATYWLTGASSRLSGGQGWTFDRDSGGWRPQR